MGRQLGVSLLVGFQSLLVPIAVELDGDLGSGTEKIEDVRRPPWMLSAKLEAVDLPVS